MLSYSSGSDKDIIIRSKGDFPPSTYSFMVESFSKLLKETKKEKLESCVFESGGHKWKLVLYPFGDPKRNAKDHISLYLAMAEENAIPDGFSLPVRFEFYIHDQVQDNYLIIKNDKMKCYNASKKEHGFHKLLPLSMFEDLSNGYLVDDTCVFGVDVKVFNFTCRRDKFKLIKNPPNGTYTWNISNFSMLEHHECLSSEFFTVAGCKWKLLWYPKGLGTAAEGKYISLSLWNSDDPRKDVYVEFSITVKEQGDGFHTKFSVKDWYQEEWVFCISYQFSSFQSREFLVDDKVIVEVEITTISAFEAC